MIKVEAKVIENTLGDCLVTTIKQSKRGAFAGSKGLTLINLGKLNYAYRNTIYYDGITYVLAYSPSYLPKGRGTKCPYTDRNGRIYQLIYLPERGRSMVVPVGLWPIIKELIVRYNLEQL